MIDRTLERLGRALTRAGGAVELARLSARDRRAARFRGAAEELGEPLQVLRPTSCFCSLRPQSSDSAACWLPLCRIAGLWGDLRRLSIKSHRQIPRHDAISGGTNRFCSSSGRVPAYVRLLRLAPPPRSTFTWPSATLG